MVLVEADDEGGGDEVAADASKGKTRGIGKAFLLTKQVSGAAFAAARKNAASVAKKVAGAAAAAGASAAGELALT